MQLYEPSIMLSNPSQRFQTFSSNDLEKLTNLASETWRLRKNLNLHTDFNDPVQYFVNRILKDSYIRPHCHDIESGIEILVSLSGLSVAVIFDDNGIIENFIFLQPLEALSLKDRHAVLTVPPMTWHTVIALDHNVTLLEIKKGPFNPIAAKKFATWSPEEDSELAQDYLRNIVEEAQSTL